MEEVIQKLHREGYLVINAEHFTGGQGGLLWKLIGRRRAITPESPLGTEGEKSDFSLLAGGKSVSRFQLFGHVSARELISFAVQLSALLKAGVPLIRSLQVVQKGTKNKYFKSVFGNLIEQVSGGFSLSHAIGEYRNVFPSVWMNLVEVGEASGNLPNVLDEIAHYQEAIQRIKSKVISALFYPSILILFATCAVGFLLLKIIPKFEEIFVSLNAKLPTITEWVIIASKLLRNYFPIFIVLIVAGIVGAIFANRTKTGKVIFDFLKLQLPIMGQLILQVSIVRFTRSFRTLMKAGVPILQSLEIAGRLAENAVMEEAITEAREAIRGGRGLGVQLEAAGLFPVFMTQLVSVGEEAGELERFLEIIANYYEERVDTFLSRLSTMLEPLLLIVVGAVIGVIVVAMFLPIMEISTSVH